MNKIVLFAILSIAISTGTAFADCGMHPGDKKTETVKTKGVKAGGMDCANCPMHKKAAAKKCANKMCPEAIEGVETVAKNTATGVEITMTAKDEETIARVQELTLVHYSNKETMDKECPARVEGAESKIENTATGVKVILTGKTPAAIKKIQEASNKEHKKTGCPDGHKAGAKTDKKHACPEDGKKEAKTSGKYACPMKCAESDKPGKCPKCGMAMTGKK
ncbi:MAG: heavy metal-binding domain-containing protein [Elusimicrobiota bacterium]|nr:heavy metal-binding domain-containing protein [Elusimicrobiota bacterium]